MEQYCLHSMLRPHQTSHLHYSFFKLDELDLPRGDVEGSFGQLCLCPDCFLLIVGYFLWGTDWVHMFLVIMLGDQRYLVQQYAANYSDILEN